LLGKAKPNKKSYSISHSKTDLAINNVKKRVDPEDKHNRREGDFEREN
jgi:hypothetical protein